MFAYLRGSIQSKEITEGAADRLILDVAGFGVEIHVSRRTLMAVGQLEETVTVPVALAIRENDLTVFGFATNGEKELFTLLQSVTGIGPKLALALVGTFSPEDLAQAILDENQKLITQAPGVGAKVAQRIILELKSRVKDWQQKFALGQEAQEATGTAIGEEVRSILAGLGYTPTEVGFALTEARKANVLDDVESLVRYSLKSLGAPTAN